MTANPIWIAGYFGPVAGASPVWIAPGDGTVPSAVQSEIVSYYAPVAGATAVWIAGFFAPPPAAIGATPITISGWGGSGGGGGPPPVTSVWSAADASANGMTLSNGGLTVTPSGAGVWQSIRSSVNKTSGKLYVELSTSATVAGNIVLGLASAGFNIADNLGDNPYSFGWQLPGGYSYGSAGFTALNITNLYTGSPAANDVLAMAIDFTAQQIWIAHNNVWGGSSNPATGTVPNFSFVLATTGALFAGLSFNGANSGVWTLQSTAASQKYAPPSGFSAWDSAAPTHSPQALAYLARTVGGNEGGNGANIATLIDGLVSDGVWAKLDALYVLAQQNQTDALLNLVGTSYGLTLNALEKTPSAFTAYKGFNLAGSSGINTGFIPSSAPSPHFTLNSSSIGGWMYDAVGSNSLMVGTSSNQTGVYPTFAAGGTYYAMCNAAYAQVASPNIAGWYAADGTATTVNAYFNGSSLASAAVAPVALDTVQVSMGTGATGNWVGTISAAFIGGSLGAAGQLALYNRLRTYMTSIGVP